MPKQKQPENLKSICMLNIANNIEKHWLKLKKGALIDEKSIDDPESNFSRIKYILSPFEILGDNVIDQLLKILYKKNQFNKNYFCLCIHARLKTVNLSFIKKKGFFSPAICNFMANNSFGLVELNLHAQYELNPRNLCAILQSMKYLKSLNLSHTKANRSVTQQISANCKQLENLNLENCKLIYDECIEDIYEGLNETIKYLNIDNIHLSDEVIEKCLDKCKNLKFLYASELITRIAKFNDHLKDNENSLDNLRQYGLETFYIDSDVNLTTKKMETLSFSCPHLKILRINCVAQNQTLSYLNSFHNLSELILANNNSLISFRFGGYFLDALKSTLGKNLKNLHLIHLVDVNLKSILKHCKNLVKLNVEFLGYYQPAVDESLNENENEIINSLNTISISNTTAKHDQIHLNIGQFKKDLMQMLSNGKVKSLSLSCLNELDDEYFQCLFSKPTAYQSKTNFKLTMDSIEVLELKQMNNVGAFLINDYFLNNTTNSLNKLILNNCKLISKIDHQKMIKIVNKLNLNCEIQWI